MFSEALYFRSTVFLEQCVSRSNVLLDCVLMISGILEALWF